MDKIAGLDLQYYSGKDYYSDGSIEDTILELVKQNKKVDIDSEWALKYHLSEDRGNILEWYDLPSKSTVLEIGAGCGAITTTLLKKDLQVTAIEMSYKRALINHERNKSENLNIIVGNFFDVKVEQKYDYVTIIGVLEYIEAYSIHTYEEFLKKVKGVLKPHGKVLLAIENRFGLKYFAGAREDHSGVFFEGIEGYTCGKGVKTFTKKELIKLIEQVGFLKYNFYYPFPDYKFPYTIFSDEYLPRVGDIRNILHNYDQDRLSLFDEEKVYDSLIENKLFAEFSNSFLVEIGI
nr:class I SAM-dependent methyltransferase [uncultured Cellulosilyticum sp.]